MSLSQHRGELPFHSSILRWRTPYIGHLPSQCRPRRAGAQLHRDMMQTKQSVLPSLSDIHCTGSGCVTATRPDSGRSNLVLSIQSGMTFVMSGTPIEPARCSVSGSKSITQITDRRSTTPWTCLAFHFISHLNRLSVPCEFVGFSMGNVGSLNLNF
jgi:hypothetical protein